MVVKNVVKKSSYYDSVTLMQVSNRVSALKGIFQVAAMMGTDHNKGLLTDAGLLLEEGKSASPNDLIIAVKAETEEIVGFAIKKVEDFFLKREVETKKRLKFLPKTLDSALKVMPDANLAIISVPGPFAKAESLKALKRGLHVHLFSDNVSLEAELELKLFAREKGLLMMGPDCGTAIINGVALGFANAVRRGNIGIVAAAGTGLQEVSCLIDREGLGISQAIGTGGRDLSERIGGIMMSLGTEALKEDPETKIIILISKPPAEEVTKKILDQVRDTGKPAIVCFLGGDPSIIEKGGCIAADTLEEAAFKAVDLVKGKGIRKAVFISEEAKSVIIKEFQRLVPTQRYVRGLFSGGTLCYEALLVLGSILGDAYSNTPLKKEFTLKDIKQSKEHTLIDLGADEFTIGRPHPMIDPRLRVERLIQEAQDEEVAVVLLDVVLGYGVHPDPAGALLPAITEAKRITQEKGRYLSIVTSVCGTEMDPQKLSVQENKLREAEVVVVPTNAQAARVAGLIATRKSVRVS